VQYHVDVAKGTKALFRAIAARRCRKSSATLKSTVRFVVDFRVLLNVDSNFRMPTHLANARERFRG
jgi:hypothetical protein